MKIFQESLGFYRYRPAAALRVSGEDALTFLQGQFTQELRSSSARSSAYGLWLNQKGKVLADSFVLTLSPTEARVISYFSSAAVIRERLESYIIADDVTIEDLTVEQRGLTLIGAGAEAWAQAAFGTSALPPPGSFALAGEGFLFAGRRATGPAWEWIGPSPQAIVPEAREWNATEVEVERITSKIPKVPVDVGANDLPNEGGLEVDAISYTKGCYLGQEVMARLKSLGQVRRGLYRVKGVGERPSNGPATLYQQGKKVGELRSTASADGESYVGLAMLIRLAVDLSAPMSLSSDPVAGNGGSVVVSEAL